ncbi:MAG: hypothetical protein IJF76_04410 [Clostridia bacterium]|nr:hypothetical protein [Clostridia bacterium]
MQEKKSDVGKIYKTTDGFFNDKPHIKKPRRVVAVQQRKDDGALAVSKIYSKEEKKGTAYIEGLILYPEDHPSLDKESIVGSSVIFGVKKKDGTFKAIYKSDIIESNDKLTQKEIKTVQRKVQRDTKQHRKTYKSTVKKWKNHFK